MKIVHRTVYGLLYAGLLPLAIASQPLPGQVYNYSTFAGTVGTTGNTSSTFNEPVGVAVDSSGNVYVADKINSLIRMISPGGVVTTLAGSGAEGHHDATGALATFFEPQGVAVDSLGNVFVADTTNDTIRRITPMGVVTTYAGTALSSGLTNSNTVATAATFAGPVGVAVDSTGNVYVADTGNSVIRKIAPGSGSSVGGVVTTFATGFDNPEGIACDSSGNVYVADTFDGVIDAITTGGTVSTLAGTSGTTGSNDGTGPAAQFDGPVGITLDGSGNIYVADTINETIRKVTQGGVVTTVGGTPGTSTPFTNGTDSYAIFKAPEGIAAMANGTLFVGDTLNEVVREGVALAVNNDFNGDSMPDIFWENTSTGERGAYIMNGTSVTGWDEIGTIPLDWNMCAIADFTGNGNNDILWENNTTGLCGFYIMSGTTVTGWITLANVPTEWQIRGAGNFHGTGSNDIIWQNTTTGLCGFYIMDGTTVTGWATLGTFTAGWKVVGTGDFNGDGKPDILWQNTITGHLGVYMMNGTSVTGWADLGTIPTQWQVAGVGDYSGTGNSDILWQNTSTGERGFYVMNGTTVTGWVELGTIPTVWQIQP